MGFPSSSFLLPFNILPGISPAPGVWEYRISPLTLFTLDLHVRLHPLTERLQKGLDMLQMCGLLPL